MNVQSYLAIFALVAGFLSPSVGFAQFGGGQQGGAPQGGDPQRAPVDENQKIREKAGADDDGRWVGKKRPTTPKDLYEESVRLLERGYYTKAQEYLERVRIRFPFSQYATLADLKMGEVYLKKGEYAMAVESYRQFRKLHPKHPETHAVIYMMAQAEFEQAPAWASRDQAAARRALEIIDGARPPATRPGFRFEDRFPDSPHIEDVEILRAEARERLAKQLFHIGRFYHKRSRYAEDDQKEGALRAAVQRYEDLKEGYPTAEIVPKTQLMEVRCLVDLGEVSKAEAELESLKTLAPDSRAYQLAKVYFERHSDDPKIPIKTPDDAIENTVDAAKDTSITQTTD